MSTGLVFLHCTGIRAADIELTSGHEIDTIRYRTEKIYSSFGPLGGKPVEGVCGVPIVSEELVGWLAEW